MTVLAGVPMKVLIADDNASSCKLLRAVLEAEGYEVTEAADGREALELLERQPVDAIIADLLMPNLDGYRLCREIRRDERWRKIPYICYTAIYGSPNDEKLAFELGADAYLRKPVSSATLLGTLRAAMRPTEAEPSRTKAHRELDVLNQYSRGLVARLEEKHFELKEKGRLAELAVEVGVALTHRKELGEILQACVESMVKQLDAALARIWMLNEKEGALELRASAGTNLPAGRMPLGQAIAGRIAKERRPYGTNAALGDPRIPEQAWVRREGVAAFAGYPLIVEERLMGVMTVYTRQQLPETARATLAAIADSLALGIQGKSAEAVLRDSEERFRQLAENISQVFWMTDPAKKQVLYVSPAYETIWGRPCATLYASPQSWLDAIHPEDRERVFEEVRAGTYVPEELEYRIVRADGATRWIRDRAFPVRDARGRVIRVAGIAEDVTERRELEMQLQQAQKRALRESEQQRRLSEERLRFAAQAAGFGSYDFEFATGQAYWSPELKALFGLGPDDEVALDADYLPVYLHPDDRCLVRKVVREAFDPQGPGRSELECRIVLPDGAVRWLLVRGRAFFEGEGAARRVVHTSGIALDVTDRKQLEQEILEISGREQRRIGHDLHDDLCQRLGGLQILSGVLAEDLTANAHPRAASAKRILAQVHEALERARLLARGLAPVALEGDGLATALQELAANSDELFRIRCEFRAEVPVTLADPSAATHLYRIAQEAVTNAVKHGRANQVLIHLTDAGDTFELKVTDNGRGFSPQAATARGMGLRIMKYRATMIGATLDVRSAAGQGTTVTCAFGKRLCGGQRSTG
jgi:PAS domain S-box-containing protein